MKPTLRFIYKYFFGSGDDRVLCLFLLSLWAKERGMKRFRRQILYKLQRDCGVYLHEQAQIASSVTFRHPIGVVVGAGVVVGHDVTIYQNVTIGGLRIGDYAGGNYPEIGDTSVLFAGAKVLGKVKVGKCCIVGANAVVLADVPDGHIAVGIPARNLRREN